MRQSWRNSADGKRTGQTATSQILLVTTCPVLSQGVTQTFGGIQRWTGIVATHGLPRVQLHFVDTSISNMSRFRKTSAWRGEAFRAGRVLSSLLRHCARRRMELVHINCVPTARGFLAAWVYACFARLWRIPVVIHHHGDLTWSWTQWNRPLDSRALWALRRLVRMSQGHIVLDRGSMHVLENIGGQVFLVPNFVEDAVLQHRNGKRKTASERVRVLFAGQVTMRKGCVELLEAARQVPEADFVLLGVVQPDMGAHVRNLPANVAVLDQVPPGVVLDEMKASDIFVLPSWWEGLPMAVLEAMAVGLPVVATRVAACPEVIEDGKGGILVQRGDVAELASALRTLINDPARRERMGRFNRERVRTQYVYSVVRPQLMSIYEQVAGAHGPTGRRSP